MRCTEATLRTFGIEGEGDHRGCTGVDILDALSRHGWKWQPGFAFDDRMHQLALQQHCQRVYGSTPEYELLDEQGPDHSKAFEVGVFCNGYRYPTAWGNNKKDAEQLAAQAALTELGVLEVQEDIEQ